MNQFQETITALRSCATKICDDLERCNLQFDEVISCARALIAIQHEIERLSELQHKSKKTLSFHELQRIIEQELQRDAI